MEGGREGGREGGMREGEKSRKRYGPHVRLQPHDLHTYPLIMANNSSLENADDPGNRVTVSFPVQPTYAVNNEVHIHYIVYT